MNRKECYRLTFRDHACIIELMRHLREVQKLPAIAPLIYNFLNLKSSTLLLCAQIRPELFMLTEGKDFLICPNILQLPASFLTRAPEHLKYYTPIAIGYWFIHPAEAQASPLIRFFRAHEGRIGLHLDGDALNAHLEKSKHKAYLTPDQRDILRTKGLDKLSGKELSLSELWNECKKMENERSPKQKDAKEIEEESRIPCILGLPDMNPNVLESLREVERCLKHYMESVLSVSEREDFIHDYYHFPNTASYTSLHGQLRINMGMHPFEEQRLYPAHDVRKAIEEGEGTLLNRIQLTQTYNDTSKVRDLVKGIEGVKIEACENSYMFPKEPGTEALSLRGRLMRLQGRLPEERRKAHAQAREEKRSRSSLKGFYEARA